MTERQVSTADVRPIEEVVKELRELLAAKLSTNDPDRFVAWSILGECQEHLWTGHDQELMTSTDPADRQFSQSRSSGHCVAAGVIRRIADAYGVSNFREGVSDE